MATKKTVKAVKKGQSNTAIALEVGAGALALAAAGAGYYFYGDKKGKKHRDAASKWAMAMKSSVVKQAKTLKKIEQKSVAKIVDEATKAYVNVKNIDKKDLAQAAKELKNNWKEIQKEIEATQKKAAPAVKKQVKVAKKAVKNAVSTVKKTVSAAKKAVK